MKEKPRRQFIDGLRAGIPLVMGFIPIAFAFALAARQTGLGVWQTCSLSLFVFTGAGQMMALGMIGQGAGLTAIWLATFLLGLRHVIMSTCIMNRLREVPVGLRLLAAFGVTDETFSVFTTVPTERATLPFFLGLFFDTYVSWNLGTLAGSLLTQLLPAVVTASLAIALYAMFIGLMVPGLNRNGRLAVLVLLTALCNMLLCRVMASSWAMVISTLLGAFAGVFFVELEPGGEAQSHGE